MLKNTFCALLLGAGLISTSLPKQSQTWMGEIMDVQCGTMKTHDMMKKQIGATDAAECTRACVQQGGKAVLLDTAANKVYQLDDQQKALDNAGKRVELVGIQSPSENAIRVESIKPVWR